MESLTKLLSIAARPERAASLSTMLATHYRNAASVLAADILSLERHGLKPREIAIIRAAYDLSVDAARESLVSANILSSWDKVTQFARVRIGHMTREAFLVLYLDTKNALIADEILATGTNDHCPVYAREVVRQALLRDAKAIIICHNHPSGDCTPSRADIDMTRQINLACQSLGISLHDHVIISGTSHVSFRAQGLIA